MTPADVRRRVADYYDGTVHRHGPTPAGADWSSAASQQLRFEELARLLPEGEAVSVLDLGCGYGALADFLRIRRPDDVYVGVDLSEAMVSVARERLAGRARVEVHDRLPDGLTTEYAVASGLLNVRQDVPEADWSSFVASVVDELDRRSTRGFAFNALSASAEPEKRRDDLWYVDPVEAFRELRSRFRRVAILHDYPLWEFTAIVRKDGPR